LSCSRREEVSHDFRSRQLEAEIVALGRIGERELDLICRHLYPEGRLGREVVEFLASIRRHVRSVSPAFEELFAEAVKLNVLVDEAIDAEGASWLRRLLRIGHGIDAGAKKLLGELKREARQVSPEFRRLCEECR
jgi:hypothetical protein